MSEQGTTKDQVSLDELKRAICSFQAEMSHDRGDGGYDLQLSRAKAWRTAFKWLLQYSSTQGDQYPAFMEGIKLIRESLK